MSLINSLSGITIETCRLLLKEINPEALYQLFSDYSKDDIMKFMGLQTEQQFLNEKERYLKGWTTYNIHFKGFYLIRKDDNVTLGQCGFHTWYFRHYRAELGYALLMDEYKQQGYMKEALSPIIDFGFNEMNLNRIEAYIAIENTPSLKLLQHYGFIFEGIMRQHYYKNGVCEDSHCFSLLKQDYIK